MGGWSSPHSLSVGGRAVAAFAAVSFSAGLAPRKFSARAPALALRFCRAPAAQKKAAGPPAFFAQLATARFRLPRFLYARLNAPARFLLASRHASARFARSWWASAPSPLTSDWRSEAGAISSKSNEKHCSLRSLLAKLQEHFVAVASLPHLFCFAEGLGSHKIEQPLRYKKFYTD